MSPSSSARDRDHVLAQYDVSRETATRLDLFVAELARWQAIKNLVGPATLPEVWSRHVADSLQLLSLAPDATRWLDLGSGAGFPGLVLAIALQESEHAHVHLVESNGRKCAFLRHVARLTGAPVSVHEARIENVVQTFVRQIDVVTARALAPLDQLLHWSEPLLTTGTRGLFPKGRGVEAELTAAAKSWRFTPDLVASRTDPDGRIVDIRSVHPL